MTPSDTLTSETMVLVVPTIGAVSLAEIGEQANRIAARLNAAGTRTTAYIVVNSQLGMERELPHFEFVEFLPQSKNHGFGQSVQVAIDCHHTRFAETPSLIVVANDDLRFDPEFDPIELIGGCDSPSPVAFSMVSGTRMHIPSTSRFGVFLRLSMLSRIKLFSALVRPGGEEHEHSLEPIPGFALVRIPRLVWTTLGGFDPRFQHYYEDQDFALRSAQAGCPVTTTHLDGVTHKHGVSRELIASDVLAVEIQAARRFLTKWGHGEIGADLTIASALVVRIVVRISQGQLALAANDARAVKKYRESGGNPCLPFLTEADRTYWSEWPARSLEAQSACVGCGQTLPREPEFQGLVDWVFGSPGTWQLYRCVACESLTLSPRPTGESLGLAYSSYYTHASAPSKSARASIRSTAKNLEFKTAQASAGRGASGLSWAIPRLVSRSHVVQEVVRVRWRSLPRFRETSLNVLDVGCGDGRFLSKAERMGWNAYGVDLDPSAVAAALSRGIKIVEGTIDSEELATEHYDLITLGHVLEHVDCPERLLTRSFELLRPGGHLWIQTPNAQAPGLGRHKELWRGLEPPRHLSILSRPALMAMVESAGFEVIESAIWHPVAWSVYPQSIPVGRSRFSHTVKRLSETVAGAFSDARAYRRTSDDEFLTMLARK